MNANQALDIIKDTRQRLVALGHVAQRRPLDLKTLPTKGQALAHAIWMLDEMEGWLLDQMNINQKVWDKVQRWLGFVQGVLWTYGVATIDEMRQQNASRGE